MEYQVTITVPDSQAGMVSNMSEFANKLVQDALQQEQMKQAEQQKAQPSKWARFAEEIRNDPDLHDPEFQKAWKKVKEGMREVHEGLEFQHDK